MIISNSKRFIFIHIHKTGGTSISSALEPTLQWNDIVCGGSRYGNILENYFKPRFGLHKHCDANTVRTVIGQEIWGSYFTFAWVRNPYFRIVSLYTWLEMLIKGQGWKRYLRYVNYNKDFWQWPGVQAYLGSKDFPTFIRHEAFAERAPAAKSMFECLSNEGRLLVNFIGRVEQMEQDFSQLCESLGLEGVELVRRNVSKRQVSLRDYYKSQEDLDYIYERYRKDFETFDYEKSSLDDLGTSKN